MLPCAHCIIAHITTTRTHTQAHTPQESSRLLRERHVRCCEVLAALLLLDACWLLAPQERDSPSEVEVEGRRGGIELQHPDLPGPSFHWELFHTFPSQFGFQ